MVVVVYWQTDVKSNDLQVCV